jgi:glutaredoxin
MYSAVWCGTCQNTKAWMQQNNITFTECDIEASASCAREYRALGSGGVPTVVVRGKAMRPGFGSQEFIAMLKSCPRLERPRRDGVTTTAQAPDAVRRNGYRVMLRRAK